MKKYQLNLFTKKQANVTDKVIYFLLHYLRYIIVITQIVVISVFLWRFQVDQEIIELKENIDQKQEILKATHPLVVQAQEIDQKLNKIKKIIDKQNILLRNIDYIFSIIPNDIILEAFEINENNIKIIGTSLEVDTINILSQRIQKDKIFPDVKIEQIQRNDIGFKFSILISLQNEQGVVTEQN